MGEDEPFSPAELGFYSQALTVLGLGGSEQRPLAALDCGSLASRNRRLNPRLHLGVINGLIATSPPSELNIARGSNSPHEPAAIRGGGNRPTLLIIQTGEPKELSSLWWRPALKTHTDTGAAEYRQRAIIIIIIIIIIRRRRRRRHLRAVSQPVIIIRREERPPRLD
ncbi:hypothetical protein EYF80_010110 [Liparis tanakae]|uniref:Uncharacterized protein n=1 Tax=Liparis tanakae TaxID=230148 RepID=A0A4Z2IPE4_9TELE|nr:hypothetical protein EYF80_010110 [Liparis tanakae]